MGHDSAINQLDVSNSNTPNPVDPTNPVLSQVQRAVGQIDANGNRQVTPVNAYSGNNGLAAILAKGGGGAKGGEREGKGGGGGGEGFQRGGRGGGRNGNYYMTGNAGNSGRAYGDDPWRVEQ